MRCQLRTLTQIPSSATQKQRRRRIHDNQRSRLIFALTRKDRAHNLGIRVRITTTQMLDRSNLKPKLLWLDLKCLHFPVLRLSDMSLPRERDLIQAILTMDHPRALRPKSR